MKFECKRCGNCCQLDWDLKLDPETITKWVREKRNDLLYHVVFHPRFLLHPEYYNYEPILVIDNGHILFGDHKKHVCPFLLKKPDGKTSCKIHDFKPVVCKNFPYQIGEDGKDHVRTDILDFCRGARDYFERCAQLAGKTLDEYMQSIPKLEGAHERIPLSPEIVRMLRQRYESLSEEEKTTGLIFPELRDKTYANRVFKHLAKVYKRLHLKVRITSDKGMSILNAYVEKDINGMKRIIDTIRVPAEAIIERLVSAKGS